MSGGAYADRNLFSGAGGADSSPILLGQTSVGSGSDVTTPQWAVKAGFRGHLSKAAMTAINTRTLAAASAATALKGNKGITQLVEAKGRATFVQQGCGNGSCPGEFAATNSGAVYDGNATTGDGTDILLAPTDPVGTSVPSGALASSYEQIAETDEQNDMTCSNLDNTYLGQEHTAHDQILQAANAVASAGCGSGGMKLSQIVMNPISFFFGKKKKCKGLISNLKSACSNYQDLKCNHMNSCPLTAGMSCGGECS